VSVSVVITTVGRTDLRRAVTSAAGQTLAPHEIVIVNDRPGVDVPSLLAGLTLPDVPIRHLESGGGGGNVARNAGLDAATGDYVALLDDDDVWLAHKLETQVPLAEARTIVAARMIDERTGTVVPATTYAGGPFEAWLFDFSLRHPKDRRTLQTSGLLMAADLAREVRFDERLTVHQDWDFLLRATRQHGVTIVHQNEPLYWLSAGAIGKVSKTGKLVEEQAWAAAHLPAGSRELSFYYLTITAPRAFQRGDTRTALAAARRGLRREVSWRSVPFLLGSWAATALPRVADRG
jgi:glycosyltransferase involved in cell wall biosynthesis